ncbi:unnamed protein product [Ectocarpus sp. 12 AP-2014]
MTMAHDIHRVSLLQTSSPQHRSRWQKSRASLLFFTLPTIVALHGTQSAAWVIPVVTRPQWRQQQTTSRTVSARRGGADPQRTSTLANRRRCRPPSATSTSVATTTTTTALQSTDGGGDEKEGSLAASVRRSWREQFASLRNDAADPWSASSSSSNVVDGSTNVTDGTTSEQTGSLAAPTETVDDGIEGQAADTTADDDFSLARRGLVASEKDSAVATPAAAAAAAAAIPLAAPLPMPAVGSSNTAEEEAAEAMASRGETDTAAAQRAYRLLDAELTAAAAAASHDGPPPTKASVATLSRSAAGALLSWIRCSTDGNGLIVADGGKAATSDTVERRELWGKHAPRVLQLVKESGEEPSSDPELQQMFTEAVMYSVATQGVVEAIVSGKALAFTSAMNVLVKNFPTQDNGVAFIFQGSYYLAAPWPLRSPTKARASYEKAVNVNGRSRRNVYYAGLGRLACGDKRGAAEMFRRAVSDDQCENASPTERDIAVSLREQAQRGLDFCG